jgi:hypothetical protein
MRGALPQIPLYAFKAWIGSLSFLPPIRLNDVVAHQERAKLSFSVAKLQSA